MSEKTVAYVAFTSIVLQRARDVQWLLYCYVCGVALVYSVQDPTIYI